MASKIRSVCHGCRFTLNGINGIFCTRLHRYVQYATTQPCISIIHQQNP